MIRPLYRAPIQLAMALVSVFLLLPARPSAAQDPTLAPTVYVVKRGDTLSSIAVQFNTTVAAIATANQIGDPSLIVVGQRLVIPGITASPTPAPTGTLTGGTRVHTVRSGEILPSLAFRYGTTVWALQKANDLGRLGVVVPGQRLLIPPPIVAGPATPRFPQIVTSPAPVVQGRTVVVYVRGDRPLALDGTVMDRQLHFVTDRDQAWALAGVDAMAQPGTYTLVLEATEVSTGDSLTMQQTLTVTAGSFGTYNVAVPASRQALLDPQLEEAEREKVERVFGQVTAERKWRGLFGQPLQDKPVTSAAFGQRRSYAGRPVTSYHTGLDYSAAAGAPVLATAAGTVVLAEPLQVRGKAVILDHGLGVFTGFWHLSVIEVSVGQVVGPGEVIGRVGNTGLSTGAHLHWEMRVQGVPVNPLQWTWRAFP